MSEPLDQLSEAELAEWQYAHRDELDSEQGELVDVEISPHVSVTMSFRLPGTEADAIRRAAADAGVTMSEWIREACSNAATDPSTPHRDHVEELLADAERRLATAQQNLARARKQNRVSRKASGATRTKTKSTAAAKKPIRKKS